MPFLRRITALVVEKDDYLRGLITDSLSSAGFEVHTATDGLAGIEAVDEYRPRLVLLDVENNLEVLSRLKSDAITRDTTVIVLLGSRRSEDIERIIEAGADDYITKPLEDQNLGSTVRDKLKKSEKMRREKQRLNKLPVLVVVEDDDLRGSISNSLRSAGYEVCTAADGPSTIKAVAKSKLRLVLLDLKDEREVLSTLKYDSNTRGVHVIVLLDSSRFGDIELILEAGADDYITKPIEGKDLAKIVAEKLKKYEKMQKKKKRLKRIPVLAIDDEAGFRKAIEYNLRLDGFEVHTAEDGLSGLEAANKLRPRVILLDVVMPGMDGLDVLTRLKRNPRTSNIPVIMLTAKNLINDVSRAFALGADDYITKPFDGKNLGKTIKEKLEKHKKQTRS